MFRKPTLIKIKVKNECEISAKSSCGTIRVSCKRINVRKLLVRVNQNMRIKTTLAIFPPVKPSFGAKFMLKTRYDTFHRFIGKSLHRNENNRLNKQKNVRMENI